LKWRADKVVALTDSEVDQRPSGKTLIALRDGFTGDVIVPGDVKYDQARKVWNAVHDRHPAVIARCSGAKDVATALRFAIEEQLVVAVRGGGHSYAGFSTCDGGIVIDLSQMGSVSVDPEQRVARVAGGALLEHLDRAAQKFGLVCPVGVVGHTGVAGLTLGGGIGRLQRRYGLTIDNLLAVDILTAEGSLLHVSEQENADLFWGVRGAGANFGIVTSFEFGLHRMGTTITTGAVGHPLGRTRELGGLFREFLIEASDEVSVSMAFAIAGQGTPFPPSMSGQPYATLSATHCGSAAGAEKELRALRGEDCVFDTFGQRLYLDIQTMLDEYWGWGKRYYTKNVYLRALPDAAIDICSQVISDSPSSGCTISIQALGGAIGRISDDAMAFTGRDAAYWLGLTALWNDEKQDTSHIAWGRNGIVALKAFTADGLYGNEMSETGDDVVRTIYGTSKFERLVALKRSYDPDNVFRLNQNVRP
jgi:FAD/FMN-containing dehydrogenase